MGGNGSREDALKVNIVNIKVNIVNMGAERMHLICQSGVAQVARMNHMHVSNQQSEAENMSGTPATTSSLTPSV